MTDPHWTRDICPSRDDAQPHIYENGRCVLCLAPLVPRSDVLVRAELRLRQVVAADYHAGEQ